ncbi:MarR family transcriptional regulator [Solidesulfovibrio sp.]|uniref:MarR family winged helix-turn-helix transcriptional regulator n=1 Tax=Solidesulfovibrio sp. TaxID=2910990 RepID=UPI002B1FD60D|nr:MarR family transcriptional regulator [Solidesulfovibrio sp.]MEA4856141.1 MarR family transcriptional regulator [Solidesulfovibrio sp.]
MRLQQIMPLFYDRHQSLGHLAGLAHRLLSILLGRRFREAGLDLTAEQWGAILVLADGDSMTQQQLGARLFLEKSSVSRLVDGLERRGWIVREPDPDDGRHKLVALTSQAEAMLEPAAAIARGVLDEAQRGMPQAQRLACRELLGHIIGNLSG